MVTVTGTAFKQKDQFTHWANAGQRGQKASFNVEENVAYHKWFEHGQATKMATEQKRTFQGKSFPFGQLDVQLVKNGEA